jgi:hypothetical protein
VGYTREEEGYILFLHTKKKGRRKERRSSSCAYGKQRKREQRHFLATLAISSQSVRPESTPTELREKQEEEDEGEKCRNEI